MNQHDFGNQNYEAQPAAQATPASAPPSNPAPASDFGSDASGANSTDLATPAAHGAPQATHTAADPLNEAPAAFPIGDASDAQPTASDAAAEPVAVAVDDRRYNLTVPQAQELFAKHGRRVPATRTIQNYCAEGFIAGQKVTTSTGAEWLINDESLMAFIQTKPELEGSHDAPHPAAPAMPEPAPVAAALGPDPEPTTTETARETRTVAEMLIENAKLMGQLEAKAAVIAGKDETITELKDDRRFLRDELVQKRKINDDLAELMGQMLEVIDNAGRRAGGMEISAPISATHEHPSYRDPEASRAHDVSRHTDPQTSPETGQNTSQNGFHPQSDQFRA